MCNSAGDGESRSTTSPLKTRWRRYSVHLWPVLILLMFWEFVAKAELVNPRMFPPPTAVWAALLEWFHSGELVRDIGASYWRMLLGYGAGTVGGVFLGMTTGRIRLVNRCVTPLVQLLRPLPPVAIIPLVIVWLGIGDTAKVFSIGFAVFFPVWLNTHLGAASISSVHVWSAGLLAHRKSDIVVKVLLPAALPSIVAGMRTSVAIAFVMVYVSEIAGASAGIGYQISVSHLAYRIDKMVAALAVLAAAGAFADFVLAKCVRAVFPWFEVERKS